ncbi:hypothetical protein BGZ73_007041 [Actinomortierella ambigua]|nr:hypothetical protein BGZ73_007041 [Actinomortierella ambigua]
MGYVGGAMSLDGKIFMTLANNSTKADRFSFETNKWSASKAAFRDTAKNVFPVTLGSDDTVFIAGGLAATPVLQALLILTRRTNLTYLRSVVDPGKLSSPVFVYKMSLDSWVEKYTPPQDYLNPASPSGSPSPPPAGQEDPNSGKQGEGSPSVGAIAGGIAGAVVLMTAVGFLIWWRRRRGTKISQHHGDTSTGRNMRISAPNEKHNAEEHDSQDEEPLP